MEANPKVIFVQVLNHLIGNFLKSLDQFKSSPEYCAGQKELLDVQIITFQLRTLVVTKQNQLSEQLREKKDLSKIKQPSKQLRSFLLATKQQMSQEVSQSQYWVLKPAAMTTIDLTKTLLSLNLQLIHENSLTNSGDYNFYNLGFVKRLEKMKSQDLLIKDKIYLPQKTSYKKPSNNPRHQM